MKPRTLLTLAGTLGAAGAAYALWLRPWHLRWGATTAETQEPLPGDAKTPNAVWQTTHGITIHAPVSAVWSWIVQIGQDKAGFYSYTWLENLVGCRMPSTYHLLPEYQHIQEGDEVWLHPKVPPLPVLLVREEQAMVLGSNTSVPGTWSFYLKPIDSATTRLIIRGRSERSKGIVGKIGYHVLFEPAHFIMERKMMLTLKHLAERNRQS